VPDAPFASNLPAVSFVVIVMTARSPGAYVALLNATVAEAIVLPVTVNSTPVEVQEEPATVHESPTVRVTTPVSVRVIGQDSLDDEPVPVKVVQRCPV